VSSLDYQMLFLTLEKKKNITVVYFSSSSTVTKKMPYGYSYRTCSVFYFILFIIIFILFFDNHANHSMEKQYSLVTAYTYHQTMITNSKFSL
jgi:hypothetical protein